MQNPTHKACLLAMASAVMPVAAHACTTIADASAGLYLLAPGSHLLLWVALAIGFVMQLALIVLHRKVRLMSERQEKISHIRTEQLLQLSQSNQVMIWTYDVATQVFTRHSKGPRNQQQLSLLDFARQFLPEQFELLGDGLHQLASKEKDEATLELTVRHTDAPQEMHGEMMMRLSVLHKKNDLPAMLLGVMTNVSEMREKQQKAEKQLLQYKTGFNTAMVDMIFYDPEGRIVEMNQRAEATFNMTIDQARQNGLLLYDVIEPTKQELDQMPVYHVTGLLNAKEHDGWNTWRSDLMRYEMHLKPAHDNDGRLLGYYASGRKMEETAAAYRQLRNDILHTEKANRLIKKYIDNINYVLGVGGVRIVAYSPHDHMLTLYKGVNEVQMRMNQARCMKFVALSQKRLGLHVFDSMDACTDEPIAANIMTTLQHGGMPICLQLQFVPTHDENGRLVNYLGLCRDQSKMEHTRRMLEQERQKAQEVEELMSIFLHNMSYEIRTPLSAVVGFSELLKMPHSAEDEAIFIKQIKESSDRLLLLINDILFISRLDARMIEINKQPTDFAKTFDVHCQTAWSEYRKEGVSYVVENPYRQLVVDIDDLNVGRMMEQVLINAAQHTTQGYVRARYDYVADGLLIAITDSGPGMSQETLSHIYERFKTSTNGTGLGLPICQELARQMGAQIKISSIEGKGTTVWISVPCSVIEIERNNKLEQPS